MEPSYASIATPTARPTPRPAVRALLFASTIFLVAAAAAPSQQPPPASLFAVPARAWAVDCANNEVLVVQHPGSYLRYRMHVVDEKGDQLRDQIETPQGSVARLIQRDGRPLTPEEDAAERDRLNALLASPSAFAHHVRREQDNKKLGVDLLMLMPDAMLWSYTPGQPQLPPQSSAQSANQSPGEPTPAAPSLVVLDFKPNPQWSPPNFDSEPLTGLEGRVWIDPATRRMVRLEGDLFHAVNIGWGMVAHLYPGGKVTLHQTATQSPTQSPAPSSAQSPTQTPAQITTQPALTPRFIVDHVDEQLTLRALMVKTVRQRLVFDTADFQPVPAMTYQQAIKLLLDTPLPTH